MHAAVSPQDDPTELQPEPAGRRFRLRRSVRGGTARSSRLVAAMKMLLPAIALSLVALVVVWPQILADRARILMDGPRRLSVDADTLRMTNPRFVGVDEQDRPFEIVAEQAVQETESSTEVHLRHPQADITSDSGNWITVTAGNGVWHRQDGRVVLSGGVSLFHDAGHQLLSPSAEIDLDAGEATSDEATSGQSPTGTVTGEGFRVLERGARIVFTGKARAVLYGAEVGG